ncbi:MAG: urea transporter [Muribaculaceae bacterium]|nr:urea transporter [Muribaculaceae bacterium]
MEALRDAALCGKTLLRGVGQVMFMRDARSGLLFLAAIVCAAIECGTPSLAVAACVGTIASTVAGYILVPEDRRSDSADGLWGFNGTLAGCAFAVFFAPSATMWAALVMCAMLTVPVRIGMNSVLGRLGLSSYTAPFVLMTWVFLLAAHGFAGLEPAGGAAEVQQVGMGAAIFAQAWLKGIGQVFLLNSQMAGALILAGLAVCSLRAALLAALASALAAGAALLLGADAAAVADGLYGYSPVLTAIAVGTTVRLTAWRGALWTLAAVVGTVVLQSAFNALMAPLGIAALTAPFCAGSWLFLVYRPAE